MGDHRDRLVRRCRASPHPVRAPRRRRCRRRRADPGDELRLRGGRPQPRAATGRSRARPGRGVPVGGLHVAGGDSRRGSRDPHRAPRARPVVDRGRARSARRARADRQRAERALDRRCPRRPRDRERAHARPRSASRDRRQSVDRRNAVRHRLAAARLRDDRRLQVAAGSDGHLVPLRRRAAPRRRADRAELDRARRFGGLRTTGRLPRRIPTRRATLRRRPTQRVRARAHGDRRVGATRRVGRRTHRRDAGRRHDGTGGDHGRPRTRPDATGAARSPHARRAPPRRDTRRGRARPRCRRLLRGRARRDAATRAAPPHRRPRPRAAGGHAHARPGCRIRTSATTGGCPRCSAGAR